MVIYENNKDFFTFELWGGTHVYYKKNKTYKIDRPYGIFSNMTVSIYGIFLLEKNGYKVENIEYILNEYIPGVNIYNDLFEKENFEFDLNDFSETEIFEFESKNFPTSYGLSWGVGGINLKITDKIIKKFFSPSKNILSLYDKIVKEKKLDLNNSVFIWARKTDKINETNIPEVKEYIRVLDENNLKEKKIILQTDDFSVFEEFKNLGVNFEYLDMIPFSMDGGAFHGRMDMKSDEFFIEKYKISKLDYIKFMFVSTLICKNTKDCIIYPGNPTSYIPMIKNSYKDCYLFRNNDTYFKF